jgi:uncharacterized protein (DUF1697 family)
MPHVRDAFVGAGCRGVATYIQSGNVIFETGDADCAGLFQRIRSRVCALTGEQSTVVFRSARQVQALVKAAPFTTFESDRTLKLYAVCLAEKPRTIPRFPWAEPAERLEAIGIKGLDVLIVSRRKPSGFYGFPNQFVESVLGVAATSRNWNTVIKIAQLIATTDTKLSATKVIATKDTKVFATKKAKRMKRSSPREDP